MSFLVICIPKNHDKAIVSISLILKMWLATEFTLMLKTASIVSIIISAIKHSQRQMAVQCEIFMHGPASGDHLDKSELG